MTKTIFGPFLAFVLVALIVGVPAVSAAATKEQQQMMADIRMLQEQSQQLQILLGALNESLKATNARIDARLDEQTNVTRKAFADQKLSVDNVTNDLRVVREKVDDNNVRVSSLTQELDALRQAVQQQSAPRPTATEPDAAGAGPALAGSATAPAAPPLAVGTSPQRLWDMSQADYAAGQYDLAVQGFDAYIRSFPKSDMADDAQVQIGNSYSMTASSTKPSRRTIRRFATTRPGTRWPRRTTGKGSRYKASASAIARAKHSNTSSRPIPTATWDVSRNSASVRLDGNGQV